MIVERSMSDGWLTNTYLVAAGENSDAFLVDAGGPGTTGDMNPGDELTIGGLKIKVLHTPGHTAGMLNLLVDDKELFTGDTLFKGSVGGVRAPGSTSFEDIKRSIM